MVETNLDPALPMVPCWPAEFSQVLLTMLVNAAHAIAEVLGNESKAEKGRIVVCTQLVNRQAEISIADTGIGIPKDLLTKIFDPLFATQKTGSHTGQGLMISHAVVVEKLKGSMTVQSQAGKGTTFVIRLPLENVSPAVEKINGT